MGFRKANIEVKEPSSLWETFHISLATRWPWRNVCNQKILDEQTGGRDVQSAGRGGVSITERSTSSS